MEIIPREGVTATTTGIIILKDSTVDINMGIITKDRAMEAGLTEEITIRVSMEVTVDMEGMVATTGSSRGDTVDPTIIMECSNKEEDIREGTKITTTKARANQRDLEFNRGFISNRWACKDLPRVKTLEEAAAAAVGPRLVRAGVEIGSKRIE
jgi:hypothetical protein